MNPAETANPNTGAASQPNHQQNQGVSKVDISSHTPMIAGYVGLKYSTVPGHDALVAMLVEWGLNELKVDDQETPSEACLVALLDRKVVMRVPQDEAVLKTHMRIRDAIHEVVEKKGTRTSKAIAHQLELLGVRPKQDELTSEWKLAVAASQHHREMHMLTTGTAWARGAWKDALLRLPGSTKGQSRLAGDSVKVVIVRLPDSVLNPLASD